MHANATFARRSNRLREAALRFASELLAWAVESVEDAAALLCSLFGPRGLSGHLAREEKRALFAELVVGAVGKRYGLRLGMILLGPVRERPGVLSFPVGARSFRPSDAGATGCRDRRNGRPDADPAGGYKVLDAVLLRRRRGPIKTETLIWRVTLRDRDGSQPEPAELYADRERALLDFYSG
jgi:hypothetical protein